MDWDGLDALDGNRRSRSTSDPSESGGLGDEWDNLGGGLSHFGGVVGGFLTKIVWKFGLNLYFYNQKLML